MIETGRLTLRGWRDGDATAHRAIVTDPRVAATLGEPPGSDRSGEVVARQRAAEAEHGHCFWAAEERATDRLIGWCGLLPAKAPLVGETEIGWTLAADRWGRGLAHEAALAVLDWAWSRTTLRSIAAITATRNARSRALMERLGMTRFAAEDFDHPDLPEGHPLRRHLVYRIVRPDGR